MKTPALILLLTLTVCAGTFAQKTAEDLVKSGIAHSSNNEYDKAIADITEAIRLKTDFAEAYASRASVYFLMKDYDKAIADYTVTIRLNYRLVEVYRLRRMAYYYKSDYDKTIADFTEAIRLNHPDIADVYGGRGNAYFQKQDYDKAIADYTEAIKLDPSLTSVYYYRANAYYWNDDYDKAIADMELLLKIDPNNADVKEAIEIVQKAKIEANEIFINSGNAHYEKKEYDQAIADFEAALKLFSNNARAKAGLEKAKQARGN
jgi:tetratricopeptide (TPR) repeat protein